MLFLFVILKYRKFLMLKYFSKRGYVKIFFRLDNKRILEKFIKLDKYNSFQIKKGKYTLEKLQDFIIGYDKNNFPIFMFDKNFILPLTITEKELTATIKKDLGITDSKKISALVMKLDSSILKTVYDKKLISDLYSVSGSEDFKRKMVMVIIGIVLLVILYYTGILSSLLSFVGINIAPP